MAEVTRTKPPESVTSIVGKSIINITVGKSRMKMVLPTKAHVPVYDLNRHHMLITGEPGTGKTTLGIQEPGCFLLTFDPKREYAVVQEYVPDWRHFQAWLDALQAAAATATSETPFPYKRVVIDGCDIWQRCCQDWVCQELGIKHPKDGEWGQGWDMLNQTFARAVDALMALPCGVWFTCHARDKEHENRDGTTVQRLAPILKGSAEEILVGRCAIVLNIRYEGRSKMRVGTIRGDESVVAKCCIDGRFVTPSFKDKGGSRPISEIILGNRGPAEAWQALLSAYNNKTTVTTYAEYLVTKKTPPKTSGKVATAADEPEEVEG